MISSTLVMKMTCILLLSHKGRLFPYMTIISRIFINFDLNLIVIHEKYISNLSSCFSRYYCYSFNHLFIGKKGFTWSEKIVLMVSFLWYVFLGLIAFLNYHNFIHRPFSFLIIDLNSHLNVSCGLNILKYLMILS